jgi:hypothetical protein
LRPYDDPEVSKRKRGRERRGDGAGSLLDAYRRIRKPMPPPEHVHEDRRRRTLEDEARRQIEEASRREDPPER